MSKKMAKALSILLVAALMLGIAATPVLAGDNVASLKWDDITITSETSGNTAVAARNISGQILGVVQVIGVAVAVVMLIVLAIKYISAAPNDKAEIKKHAVVYVIGAVVLFAASGILGIIRGFAEQVHA